jgi:hypothetical protein
MRPLIQLAQSRIEIATNAGEARAGEQPHQLRNPAHAAGADRR